MCTAGQKCSGKKVTSRREIAESRGMIEPGQSTREPNVRFAKLAHLIVICKGKVGLAVAASGACVKFEPF